MFVDRVKTLHSRWRDFPRLALIFLGGHGGETINAVFILPSVARRREIQKCISAIQLRPAIQGHMYVVISSTEANCSQVVDEHKLRDLMRDVLHDDCLDTFP